LKNTLKLLLLIITLCACFYQLFGQSKKNITFTFYSNPVIPGFHPDPSICRVGDDYYLVNSSFEYFPGVPVYHSKDLVHWEQIGYCLTRENQVNLKNCTPVGGIYAPVIRYHNGLFYMITTNVTNGGHFYVTAANPKGPWSNPIFVDGEFFDPDIFWDSDGKAYFMHMQMTDGIQLQEIDTKTGKLSGEAHTIWKGFDDPRPEGPHIYKIKGYYYLLVAEGGTWTGHMVVMARSKNITGPYTGSLRNPIITHRDDLSLPISSTGHADLIEDQKGNWWMVLLGVRPVDDFHNLGRETFLTPVIWNKDGFPEVPGNRIRLEARAPILPVHIMQPEQRIDSFNENKLSLCWNFIRNPDTADYSLSEKPGSLLINTSPVTLSEVDKSPAFVGRRQEAFSGSFKVELNFDASGDNEEAGVTVLMDEGHHYDFAVTNRDGKRVVIVRETVGKPKIVNIAPIKDGSIILSVTFEPHSYNFGIVNNNVTTNLLTLPAKNLSSEIAGGFTGVYLGMYASGNGKQGITKAYFNWAETTFQSNGNCLK
jgi:alpha-N-arabinofuranosidase